MSSRAPDSVLAQLLNSDAALPGEVVRWLWSYGTQTQDDGMCVQLARRYSKELAPDGVYPDTLPLAAVQELVSSGHIPESVALRWATQASWKEVCRFLKRPNPSEEAVKACLSWAASSSYGVFVAVEVLGGQSSDETLTQACELLVDAWLTEDRYPPQIKSSLHSLDSVLQRGLSNRPQVWVQLLLSRPCRVIAEACIEVNPYPSPELCEALATFAYTEGAAVHAVGVINHLLNQPALGADTLGLVAEWVRLNAHRVDAELACQLEVQTARAHLPEDVSLWTPQQVYEFLHDPQANARATPPVVAQAALLRMPCAHQHTHFLTDSEQDWVCRHLQNEDVDVMAEWLYRLPRSNFTTRLYSGAAERCTEEEWVQWCRGEYVCEEMLRTGRFRTCPSNLPNMSVEVLAAAECLDLARQHLDEHLDRDRIGTAVRLATTWKGSVAQLVNTVNAVHEQ